MISVIVCGRNDAHGYNLHKRAALSLNCIAEVLTEQDEILFVDWNTPDALPTFPEAIADTLTERCRALMRVIRVRADTHARFTDRTHLPLLDSVGRNVALRRSNPRNEWVLSTTTDMIFVPYAGRTLAAICTGLPEALHHCPRFGLPEMLWEGLDRSEPQKVIAEVGAWGRRFRLDEIVHADSLILFDGPGDFQLAPRRAMIAVGGLNEEMLLTYHTDTDLARRLSKHLGPVRSLETAVRAYHCEHYRIGSVHHSTDKVENLREGSSAEARADDGKWGLPDCTFEEIRLDQDRRGGIFHALGHVVQPLTERLESSFVGASYNDLRYDLGHVLTYVTDWLTTLPAGTALAISACRPAFASTVADIWRTINPAGRILAGPQFDLGAADAFLFEFGSVDNSPGAAWSDVTLSALAAVEGDFLDGVSHERARAGAPRRFAVVNAINTAFDGLADANLAVTYTPYTSRLRHGIVRLPRISQAREVPATSAVCNAADWDDPGWASALNLLGEPPRERRPASRHRSTWEAAHLIHVLTSLGPHERTGRALVYTPAMSPIVARLTRYFISVDVIAFNAAAQLERAVPYRPERLHRVTEGEAAGNYDVIIRLQHLGVPGGLAGLGSFLQTIEPRLKVGGLLIVSTEMVVGGAAAAPADWIRLSDFSGGKVARALARHSGWRLIEPPEWRCTLENLMDPPAVDGRAGDRPHTALRSGDLVHTTALLIFRRERPSDADSILALGDALLDSRHSDTDQPLGGLHPPPASGANQLPCSLTLGKAFEYRLDPRKFDKKTGVRITATLPSSHKSSEEVLLVEVLEPSGRLGQPPQVLKWQTFGSEDFLTGAARLTWDKGGSIEVRLRFRALGSVPIVLEDLS